jgi:GTP cyclohydrolase IA
MASGDPRELLAALLESLGAAPGDPRLVDTPSVATDFLARFVEAREAPTLSLFPAEGASLVKLEGLRFYSLCEHHLLPFFGTIDLTYAPSEKVAGFGGLERGIAHFATRLQLQERMTRQLADFLEAELAPRGLRVISKARQMCLEMAGGSPETLITAVEERGSLRASVP